MTIKEIEMLETDFLTVKQVADCLHMAPQIIRDQATVNIRYLGFPICRAGHAFRIPKAGFVAWAKGTMPIMVYPNELNTTKGVIVKLIGKRK